MPSPDDSFDVEKYILDNLGPPEVKLQGFVYHREFPGLYGSAAGLPPADGGPDPHYRPTDNPERLMIVQGSNPPTINVTTPSGIPVLNEDGTQMTIEDSKEGWSEAMLKVLEKYTRPDPENPCATIIDFSKIRHRGDPIATAERHLKDSRALREIINRLTMNMVTPWLDPHDADIPILIDVPPTSQE